jgi:hypothetical protein
MRIATAVIVMLVSAMAEDAVVLLRVGTRVPAVTLADQHDVKGSITADTRCVLFSRDMDATKVVREALGEQPAQLLDPARAVIVADISAMPSLITKLFALPAMRKRPFRMLLDTDGSVTREFPSEEGKVTVLSLNALTIERIEYIDSAEALRAALRQAAQPVAASAGTP